MPSRRAEALIATRQQRAALLRIAVSALHLMFLWSTVLVVWAVRRRALARAGHRPVTFLRGCLAQYGKAARPWCTLWQPAIR